MIMSENNEKFNWLKYCLQLFVFVLLFLTVNGDNSTEYPDDEMDTYILIKPAPPSIPQCGVNEVYQSCEVNCIDCEKRGVCEPENCHISHCDCRINFVHLTPGGPCEHVSVCPSRECPENEVYRHCGPYCEYCDMAQCRTLECLSRCYCKQGYRRNRETGKCIPEKECPERLNCLSNDAVAKSGPSSEHCMLTESEVLRANETIEEEKCYCPSGFKRNIHGWCIEEELCTYVSCMEQTEFQDCPRKCNTTCWNYGDSDCQEDGQCYPSCFCAKGYVLNEFFACIPLEMCPPGSNPFVPTLPPPTVSPIPEPSLEETSEATTATTAESDSATSVSNSSGTGSDSATTVQSTVDSESSSDVAKDSKNSKESEAKETTAVDETTEAPKKPPKKATSGGKVYKSAARKGKTVSPTDEDD